MKRFYKFLMPLVAIVAMALPWNARAQVTVTIGDGGTTTNSYLPMYTLYNNTLSEQIYTPAEVTMPGIITSIAFYNGGTEKSPNVKIYMINTNRTDFSSDTDWLPVTASDLVFQGNVTFTANQWTTITLDNPFTYDGSSNLGLIFDGNIAWSSGLSCRVFSGTPNCAMYVYSDGTDYNAVGATYSANNRLSVKNQIQLGIIPADMDCYPVRNVTASNIGSSSCTLTWSDTNNSSATYTVISLPDSTVMVSGVTDTTVDLTNLISDHSYTFGIFADCGGDGESMVINTNVHTLVSCPNPSNLVVDSVTTTEITLHWTPGFEENEWYLTIGDSVIGSVTDTIYTITNLTLNTLYNIGVRAVCGVDDTSIVSATNARTLAGDPISVFPYTCGFEVTADGDQANDWVLENGSQTNQWYVGAPGAHSGTNGLFISSDNGTSNTYNTDSISHVYAYAVFNFSETGEYTISYDWKSQGESRYYDWLRVFLAPASQDFVAGSAQPLGSSTYNAAQAAVATGWIELTGRTSSPWTLAQQSTWQNLATTFTITNPGIYKLVLMWSNDGSGGTQPPASVDNISINLNTCPAPVALTVDSLMPTAIGLHWTTVGQETEWALQIGDSLITGIYDTAYTVTGLEQYTQYTMRVYAVCDAGDTSLASSPVTARTTVSCPWPESLTATATGDTVMVTWAAGNGSTATDYYLVYGTTGFNPASVNENDWIIVSGTTSYEITGLTAGLYDVYVRTDCGGDDGISDWTGPASVGLGYVNIDTQDTLYTCGAIICDNGGPNGNYTASRNDQIVVYPSAPNNGFVVTGTSYTEGSFDYLTIYDGVGTGGTVLFRDNTSGVSSSLTVGPLYTEGPVTLAFHSDGSVYYAGFQIALNCYQMSNCSPLSNAYVNGVSNNVATVNWVDTTAAGYNSVTVLWGTGADISSATDSATVTGVSMYQITGLAGSTTYNVWVRGDCDDESSRAFPLSFTTTPDCMPVENLTVAGVDYHAFGLNWDAPSVGNPATEYIVSWRYNSTGAWTSDTVATTYYYIDGLGLDSLYQYRVATLCDSVASAAITGTVRTLGCGTQVTDGGAGTSYLPTYPTYEYSYTQQIYLDAELTNVDTIASISFYNNGDVQNRNVTLYMANTTRTGFSSTSDYIGAADLTQVATGTLNGTGWLTLTLTTPFVRTAGSNLAVVMHDNTGSWVSAGTWAATSTSNVRGIYFYQDGTAISMADPSATYSSTVNAVNQILISGPTCQIPVCGKPVIFVTEAGTDHIDITWNTENGASYEVAYQIEGSTTWTVADAANTTGTASITGLTAGLNLTVRVTFDCNGTTLVGTRAVSTACGAVALPLTEDFESLSGVYSRNCWTIGSTNLGTSYPEPIVVNLTGDPNKLCLLYNGAYMILPEVDAPLEDLQIRFNFTQGGDNVRFLMGLIADPEAPITSMVVLDTLIRSNIDTSTSTVNITYQFAGIDTAYNHYHIAFWDAFNDNYSFLDNLVVEYVPLCTPATGLAAAATANSADISWANNGSNGTSYMVEYGPRGFIPGTGTIVAGTTSPVTINGLAHSTSYDAYVYTVCGGTGDTSIASQVVQFATECNVVSTLPYSVNFENILPPGSGSSVVMVPNCWATTTIGGGTAPRVYYTTSTNYAPSQAYCLYLYDLGVAAMPEMSMPLDSLMVSFHLYNGSPSNYGLIVGAVDSVAPGFAASFQPIDTILFESGVYTYDVTSFLTDYNGTANRIALMNYNTAGNSYASLYIDDLTIDYVPSCIAPQRVRTSALTNVSADIAWTVSQAPSYSVEYGLHGFTPGTGTSMTTTTRSVSLTGLTPLTQYDVRIVSLCSATETSDTTVFTFTTLRAAPVTTYPYVCDFSDSAMAAGWELVNGNQANAWYTGGTFGNTGESLYISSDNGASNSYNTSSTSNVTAFRTFALNAGSYNFNFQWKAYAESCCDYLRAFLVPVSYEIQANSANGISSTGSPAGWIALDGGNKMNQQNAWQTVTEDIVITSAGNYNLVFFWHNDGSVGTNPPASVDNVEVYLNTCPAPGDIHAISAGTTSVTIDWTDLDTTFVAWNIEYGPTGYVRGSSVGTSMNVTSHPVTVNGLDSLTAYDFYVQPICSGADTGRWSSRAIIGTSICDNAAIASTGTQNGTNYYAPVNNYYHYTLTQTIIDSAELAGIGTLSSIAYYYDYSSPMTDKSNVTIWLQPTTKSTFSNSSDVVTLDTSVAVQVYSGNLNCQQGWNYFSFTDEYDWDGHSNLLVIVDDNSDDYNGSSYVFGTASCSGYKTLTYYSDSYNPDPLNPAGFSGSTSYYQWRPVMQLVSCGSACAAPAVNITAHDYQSATVNAVGSGLDYELVYGTDIAALGNAMTSATGAFTITGLTPNTQYFIGVRQQCDSATWSDYSIVNFTTDDLPCFAPTDLNVVATTFASATLGWTSSGSATTWAIELNGAGLQRFDTVGTNPYTITGLYANQQYTVAVRAICLMGTVESDWSDTITFTTDACAPVQGVAVSGITTNSATVSWMANNGVMGYKISYGDSNFYDNEAIVADVDANTTSYTMTGLEEESAYEVYVQTKCAEGIYSVVTAADRVSFRTTAGGSEGIYDAESGTLTLFPNPASTSVTVTVSGMDGEVTVEIVDLNGRTSGKWTVESGKVELDLSGMAQGAYFVRVTGERQTVVRKLIVR